ncbi:hypothetical protein Gotur_013784 [Gossypium turneri]
MSLISRRSSSTSSFFRKTPYILVWMAGRLIFLGFNRTPYEPSTIPGISINPIIAIA